MNPKLQVSKENKVPLQIAALVGGLFCLFFFIAVHESRARGYSVFTRTWGFDHILFFETPARLFYLFICILFVVPYSNYILFSSFNRLISFIKTIKWKFFFFSLLSVLGVWIFYLCSVKYYFLGDFNLRLIQTMKKEFVNTEYMTMRLLYELGTFGAKHGLTHDQVFKMYSCLMGGFYIFISCLLSDLLGKDRIYKILLFLTQVSSALLLIFCGYVEIYATPAVLLLLYVYCSIRYISNKAPFIIPFLALLLACAAHLINVAALPSLFVLYYFVNREKFPYITRLKNRSIALIIFLLMIVSLYVAFGMKSGFLHVWTAPRGQKIMTFLSVSHVWEILNGQVLCCGLYFLFVFLALFIAVYREIRLTALHYFMLTVTGCMFLLILISNLQRGSGDWDIMAFPAITMNLTAALVIIHVFAKRRYISDYLIVAFTALNLIHAFLWITINHTDRSIKKIETMLINDPGTYYSARIGGPLQLALAYKNNRLYKESEDMALYYCNNSARDDLKGCVMYGQSLKETNRLDEAKDHFESLLKNRSPYIYEAYLFLLDYHGKKNHNKETIYYLNMLFDSFMANPDAFLNNINFKKPVMIALFDTLRRMEPLQNTKRRELIQNMINALNELKMPERAK